MQISVLFFATLKDLTGHTQFTFTLPHETCTVSEARAQLAERFPDAAQNLNSAVCAVNEEFAFAEDTIKDGDRVAFFPPVSGGQGWPEVIQLTQDSVDHDALIAAITTPATGAVCLFSGMVRGQTQKEGHIPQVDTLIYEAYEPMALAKMRQVAQEIRERWPLVQGIAIVQRVGTLSVGQNTVLIACSSGHRDQGCFEAARYGIDRLKEIVPVWKKEISAGDQRWVEGDYHPTHSDTEIQQ